MSKQTTYTRSFLKKVIRKIAYRGRIPIKKARTFLDYKPNLKNIKFILRCFKIVKFDENYFDQGSSDVYFVKIDGAVYVVEMNPVYTFTEVYPTKIHEFLSTWVEHMPGDVKRPVKSKFPFTITDHRSKVSVEVKLFLNRYMEIADERKGM